MNVGDKMTGSAEVVSYRIIRSSKVPTVSSSMVCSLLFSLQFCVLFSILCCCVPSYFVTCLPLLSSCFFSPGHAVFAWDVFLGYFLSHFVLTQYTALFCTVHVFSVSHCILPLSMSLLGNECGGSMQGLVILHCHHLANGDAGTSICHRKIRVCFW